MGVGGNFWDILKPYAKYEGYDYIRNKKVAVDLSYWIVQHETALKHTHVINPHLRLTFFRTINLFSKFGAFPVFIVDGKPSPLKSQARISRFFRSSGINPKDLPVAEEGVSVDRNKFFVKCVEECVELLKLLGMPVVTAEGEAEALCAQLNSEGFVDACITADSDAFLFGAKCVIKHLDPKSKEPIECYHMEDIELGLGLKRKHFIAVALLVGSDHDLQGVPGIGTEKALRFVKSFGEEEVLDRLCELGSGAILPSHADFGSPGKSERISNQYTQRLKSPHCSFCGHPGSKTIHSRVPCDHCYSSTGTNCTKKATGFKCDCSACNWDREEKEHKKQENWHLRVCKKIAECNFPCDEICRLYLRNEDEEGFRPCLSWNGPDLEVLIEFLGYYLHWEPSYIRQRIFPMLSTIFLREMALNSNKNLLHGQYEFDSVHRVKVQCGHQFYVIKWRKFTSEKSIMDPPLSSEGFSVGSVIQPEGKNLDLSGGSWDELDDPQFKIDGGDCFILTDENLKLVETAFPAEIARFLQDKEIKASKRKKTGYSGGTGDTLQKSNSKGVQLAITNYYRSSKQLNEAKSNQEISILSERECVRGKSKVLNSSPPKSVRRRLLFN